MKRKIGIFISCFIIVGIIVLILVNKNHNDNVEVTVVVTTIATETQSIQKITTEVETTQTVTTEAIETITPAEFLALEPIGDDASIEEAEARINMIDPSAMNMLASSKRSYGNTEKYREEVVYVAQLVESKYKENIEGTEGAKSGELDATEPPADPTPEYNPPHTETTQSQPTTAMPEGAVSWSTRANDWVDKYGLPITNLEERQRLVNEHCGGDDPATSSGESGFASPGNSLS